MNEPNDYPCQRVQELASRLLALTPEDNTDRETLIAAVLSAGNEAELHAAVQALEKSPVVDIAQSEQ